MKRALLPWALLLCAAACPKPKPPVPPEPSGPATCVDVCRHEAELGCDSAKPTAEGAVCVDVCENVMASTVVTWDLSCRARAATCAAIDRCEASPSSAAGH